MTPFLSLLLPIAAAGVAVFILSAIIHMTPWHKGDYRELPDEDGVMQALRPFNLPPNDYMVPHPRTGDYMKSAEFDAKCAAGPMMVVTVIPSGPWPMGRIMGQWFLFVLVVAAAVACVVGTIVAPGAPAHIIFHHAAVITFLSHAMGAVPLSIWYHRKWATTFRATVDAALYAALTGWIFSMLWPKA